MICLLSYLFASISLTSNLGFNQVQKSVENKYLLNALQESIRYYNDSEESDFACNVVIIKIVKIRKHSGEFSLSYIYNDYQLSGVKFSHWCMIENQLVLVKADSLSSIFSESTNFPAYTPEAKEKALSKLAGPYNFVTGQPADIYVFKYNRKKVNKQFYSGIDRIKVDKKYMFKY